MKVHPRCIARHIGSQLIVEQLDDPRVRHILNPTAASIWRLVEQQYMAGDIIVRLSQGFRIPPEVAVEGVRHFLRFAARQTLLVLDSGTREWLGPDDGVGSVTSRTSGELYAALMAEAEHNRIPHKASLELTYRCPLRCIQCYTRPGVEAGQAYGQELDLDRLMQAIAELRDLGCMRITFTGGEPLARNGVSTLFQLTDAVGCAIRVQTNGLLLNPTMIDELTHLRRLESLEVSLFGVTEQTYESVTGHTGSFRRLKCHLQALRNVTLPVTLKYILMKQNAHEAEMVAEFAASLGLHYVISAGQIYPSTLGVLPNLDKLVDRERQADLFRKRLINPAPLHDDRSWLCRAGFVRLNVTPLGDVWPCERLPYSFGNIRKRSLRAVWHSEEAERFRSCAMEEHPRCRECSLRSYCLHCWAMPWLYERVPVEEAVAVYRGFSPHSCRIADLSRLGYSCQGREGRPGMHSQVF